MDSTCDRSILVNKGLMNYLYGYVAGDGCLNEAERSKYVYRRVGVASSDYDFGRILYDVIKPNTQFSEGSDGCNRFFVSDPEFVGKFLDHGLVCRKSERDDKFMWWDEGFEREFVRGIFDADGGIHRRKKWISGIAYIMGTVSQVLKVRGVLENIDGITDVGETSDKGLFEIRVHKLKGLLELYRFMYKDGCVCLQRKREKFEGLFRDYFERYGEEGRGGIRIIM